jgi:hypothetical protein
LKTSASWIVDSSGAPQGDLSLRFTGPGNAPIIVDAIWKIEGKPMISFEPFVLEPGGTIIISGVIMPRDIQSFADIDGG